MAAPRKEGRPTASPKTSPIWFIWSTRSIAATWFSTPLTLSAHDIASRHGAMPVRGAPKLAGRWTASSKFENQKGFHQAAGTRACGEAVRRSRRHKLHSPSFQLLFSLCAVLEQRLSRRHLVRGVRRRRRTLGRAVCAAAAHTYPSLFFSPACRLILVLGSSQSVSPALPRHVVPLRAGGAPRGYRARACLRGGRRGRRLRHPVRRGPCRAAPPTETIFVVDEECARWSPTSDGGGDRSMEDSRSRQPSRSS
jgi:hypothetical protein